MTSRCGSRIERELVVAARRERDDRAAARLHLLHVADHLLEHVIVRREGDDRHLLVDERDRPVLHLAGRIALGVDVGDLLQLERALERDRVVDAAAEVQEVGAGVEARRRSPRSAGASFSVCSSSSGSCSSASTCGFDASSDSAPRDLRRAAAPAGTARRAAT